MFTSYRIYIYVAQNNVFGTFLFYKVTSYRDFRGNKRNVNNRVNLL